MANRTPIEDSYAAMRARDKNAWISDSTMQELARNSAQKTVHEAHTALSRFGATVASFVDVVEAKSFPSANEKRLAFAVAGAATAVAERTKELEAVLRMHESAISAIERAQLRLQEAQSVLAKALAERGDDGGAPASVGHS